MCDFPSNPSTIFPSRIHGTHDTSTRNSTSSTVPAMANSQHCRLRAPRCDFSACAAAGICIWFEPQTPRSDRQRSEPQHDTAKLAEAVASHLVLHSSLPNEASKMMSAKHTLRSCTLASRVRSAVRSMWSEMSSTMPPWSLTSVARSCSTKVQTMKLPLTRCQPWGKVAMTRMCVLHRGVSHEVTACLKAIMKKLEAPGRSRGPRRSGGRFPESPRLVPRSAPAIIKCEVWDAQSARSYADAPAHS